MSQKVPNGFVLFMLDWKKHRKDDKREVSSCVDDLQSDPEFYQHWKNLSEDQRIYYKSFVKTVGGSDDNDKKSEFGELTSDLDSLRMRELEFKVDMADYISSMIAAAKEKNNIHELKFHVIHTNHYFSHVTDAEVDEFYPAEIAIAECCLESGISRVYHQIVNERIKIGHTYSAKEYSERTHNLPINGEYGKNNYEELFQEICQFLKDGRSEDEGLPPVFTIFSKDDVYVPVKSVLSRLCDANQVPKNHLLLYSLEDLFASLYNATNDKKDDITFDNSIASSELRKETFAHKLGLECDFHTKLERGAEYCSVAVLKEWFDVMRNRCCGEL